MGGIALGRRGLLVIPLALSGRAWAEDLHDSFYIATAIVTGTDMRSRPSGFASCLRTVLTKLTGDPSLDADPRLVAAARDAAGYVVGFDYVDPLAYRRPKDDQGSYDRSYVLTVRFDQGKINALIAELDRRLWRGARPVIVPVIRMTATTPPWAGDAVLADDDPARAAPREAFANAAGAYGLDVTLPTRADPMLAVADPPDQAPRRMVIVGGITFREADLGWSGGWRTLWQGQRYDASVRGVSFDVAFDRLVRGALQLAAGTGPFG